jgi:hypothetical protein
MIIDKNKKLMTIYSIVILTIIFSLTDKIEQHVKPTIFWIICLFNLFICWWSEKQSIGLPNKHNFSYQNAFYNLKLYHLCLVFLTTLGQILLFFYPDLESYSPSYQPKEHTYTSLTLILIFFGAIAVWYFLKILNNLYSLMKYYTSH